MNVIKCLYKFYFLLILAPLQAKQDILLCKRLQVPSVLIHLFPKLIDDLKPAAILHLGDKGGDDF